MKARCRTIDRRSSREAVTLHAKLCQEATGSLFRQSVGALLQALGDISAMAGDYQATVRPHLAHREVKELARLVFR